MGRDRRRLPELIMSKFFLLRLTPPRPSFVQDMTAEEGAVMQKHFAYWAKQSQSETAIVYGPVDDPNGAWGVAIIRVADEDAARAIEADDPVVQSGLGFRYEIFPMLRAIVKE